MVVTPDSWSEPNVSDLETTDEKVAPPPEADVPDELELAGAFPAVTREQWRGEVAKVLAKKGPAPDDVEAALATSLRDGVTVLPLCTADDSPGLQLIGVVLVVGAITWVSRRFVAARRR